MSKKDDKILSTGAGGARDISEACKAEACKAEACKAEPSLMFFKPANGALAASCPGGEKGSDALRYPEKMIPGPSVNNQTQATSTGLPLQVAVPREVLGMEDDMVRKGIMSEQAGNDRQGETSEASPSVSNTKPAPTSEEELNQTEIAGFQLLLFPQQRLSQPGAYSVEGTGAISTGSRFESTSGSDIERGDSDHHHQQQQQEAFDDPYQATLVESQPFELNESQQSPSTSTRLRDSSSRRRSSHNKPDLVDAKPYEDKEDHFGTKKTHKDTCYYWIGLFLCSVAVIVTAILLLGFPDAIGLATSSFDDDIPKEHSPVSPSSTEPIIVYPPFRDDLNADSFRELRDPNSASSKANAWMWRDPNLKNYSRIRALERFALATIFHATQGDNWTRNDGWLSYEIHECDWWTNRTLRSTMCEESNPDDRGRIVNVELANNNLHGTMPFEFDYLYDLRVMDFGYNELFGTIPALGDENFRLEIALANDNQLEGMIAVKSAHMPELLRELDLSNNKFKGQILNAVALLPGLEVLRFSGNQLTGSLDGPTFGALVNLTTLHVFDCQLTGSLPSELGQLSNLKEVDVSSNDFTGVIPSQLSLLTGLELLNVDDTMLTGTIPEEFCNRTQEVNIVADCSAMECCR